jgi:hypothetical protein
VTRSLHTAYVLSSSDKKCNTFSEEEEEEEEEVPKTHSLLQWPCLPYVTFLTSMDGLKESDILVSAKTSADSVQVRITQTRTPTYIFKRTSIFTEVVATPCNGQISLGPPNLLEALSDAVNINETQGKIIRDCAV